MSLFKNVFLFSVIVLLCTSHQKVHASACVSDAERAARKALLNAKLLEFALTCKAQAEESVRTLPGQIEERKKELNAIDAKLQKMKPNKDQAIASLAANAETMKAIASNDANAEKLVSEYYELEEMKLSLAFDLDVQKRQLSMARINIGQATQSIEKAKTKQVNA